MTDEQIIKALECCSTDDGDDCSRCPYGNIVYKSGNGGCVNRCRKDVLDLINRQKAEIERLEKAAGEKFNQWELLAEKTKQHYANLYKEAKNSLKAEAIKEFAERLKNGTFLGKEKKSVEHAIWIYEIDKIVEEMTEVHE